MFNRHCAYSLIWLGLCTLPLLADDPDTGWVSLYNGKDLTGWINVNGQPNTWKAQGDELVTTGNPVSFLRTEKMVENFILDFEWKHMPPKPDAVGNSGLFVWCDPVPAVGQGSFARGIEVQVLVNFEVDWATSHGDIFSIWGAKCKPDRPHPKGYERCLPSERRAKGAGEWNHYRVEGKDGRLTLAVNGKVVSGVSNCNPRKGYLALEAEGSECRFRNIKLKELPSTNPKPDEIALEGAGFERLYNGRDLTGWQADDGHKGHWKPASFWHLVYDGASSAKDPNLWTKKEYGDFQMVVDWRLDPKKAKKVKRPIVLPSGEESGEAEVMDAGDSGIYLRGNSKSQVNIWCWPVGSGEVYGYRKDASLPAEVRAGVTPKKKADRPLGEWNRFLITMKGELLTVDLNGVKVLENARLPGVPVKGPIALQHHGDAIEFGHLYIRELK